MWESSGSTWRLTVGQVRSQLGAYGSGLAGRPMWDVCVCYKPPGQEEGEVSFRYLEGASDSQDLIPMGDFTHPVTCWRGGTAGHRGSRMLLVCVADNFLTQVIKELTKGGSHEGLQSHNQESVC